MFLIIVALMILISAIVSLTQHGYAVRFLTNMMMWIALTQSLNTITGYTGRIDFGHVLFFGIGAYVTAYLLVNNIAPWYLALAISIAVAFTVAGVLGYPTLRLHGAYFAIATWSFAEAAKQVVFGWNTLGGSIGLSIGSLLSPSHILYLMTLTAILALTINFLIERSKLYLALNAINNNELAASVYGVNIVFYRLLAYMLSSIAGSLAGAVYALWLGYVYPGDVFHGLKTDQMFVMLLLGGSGSYIGALLGSIIMSIAYEILWSLFSEQLYLVFLGVLLMAIVILMPNGIAHRLGMTTTSARKTLASLIPAQIARTPRRSQTT